MICVGRQEGKYAVLYSAVTAQEICSDEYPGLYHICWGQKMNTCLFKSSSAWI